jgi:hypothetical protein
MLIPRTQLAIMANIPQEDGEPDGSYLAMIRWVAEATPKIRGAQERRWCARWRWRERLEASPLMRDFEAARLSIVDWVDRHRGAESAGDLALSLAASQLRTAIALDAAGMWDPTAASIKDLASAAKILTEVERLREGKSTANVAIQSQNVWDPIAFARLPADAKAAMRAAIPVLFDEAEDSETTD